MEDCVNKLDKSTDASVNNELDKKIHYLHWQERQEIF